ncbi:hypothetical protein GTZ97_03850 [Aquabacterium fontiphilum]|uniref:hypothetical protein n=1 Tax=Aquabacterium fontiphilum TaxID=450365 RepID=UPI0013789B2B|nr:hypothetical protein [Aquabacterium fontiphilum]NBD19805.1 hypothetical protein [Aquabacterium fontiphilum]
MSKMKRPRTIVDKAILIGYTQEGECVYNAAMSLDKYYDGEHPWDSSEQVLALRLHRVHGYLFGTDGILDQEFESIFDLESGIFAKGWARHSDGTFQEH